MRANNTEQYEWDYLALMDDEEVDYATLSEEILAKLFNHRSIVICSESHSKVYL